MHIVGTSTFVPYALFPKFLLHLIFKPLFLCTLAEKCETHVTLAVILCVTCETCCLNGILFWRWFEDLNEKGTLHSVFLPRAWEDFFFRSCCCLYSSSTNLEFLHKNLDWLGHFLKKSTITLVRLKKGILLTKVPDYLFVKTFNRFRYFISVSAFVFIWLAGD